jgi:hypothetical protein
VFVEEEIGKMPSIKRPAVTDLTDSPAPAKPKGFKYHPMCVCVCSFSSHPIPSHPL